MFEQTVELPAVERAPGAVEVISGLRLLPGVVVVLELEVATGGEFRSDLTGMSGRDASELRRETDFHRRCGSDSPGRRCGASAAAQM